jgi:hypothetical protein
MLISCSPYGYNVDQKMLVEYSLTFRDYKAAQTLHAKRSEIPYLAHCVARYLYPVFGICILVFEFTPRHFVGSPQPKLIGTLCGLLLVSLPLYMEWVARRSYKRTRSGTGDCTIELDKEIIRTKGLHTRSEMEWTAIRSSSEDSKTFLLYLAPARFVVIPKRVCTNEQMNELRTLLQDNVKSNSVSV